MKKIIKWILIVLLSALLFKLFVLSPKSTLRFSQSIEESKRVNAFICGCKIGHIKAFESGYTFPVRNVWVEKSWEIGRNRWGIVSPVVDPNPEYNSIMFDMFSKDSFFSKENYNYFSKWDIIDSLSKSVGCSHEIIYVDYHYNRGDTVIFTIYKLNGSTIFNKETRSPLFEFEVICN